MKFFPFLSLAFAISTLSGCSDSSIIRLILLAGQSNMEGHDSKWNTLPVDTIKQYREDHDNVKINYDCTYEKNYEGGNANTSNGKFVDVDFGQGRNPDFFGPEVGIASYLGKHDLKHRYYLIKSCEGSSSLFEHWTENGRCYQTFINDVSSSITKLKKEKFKVRIVGFMWMQGEDDAKTEENANKYHDRMLGLINRINEKFKSYLPSYGIPVIDAGITTDGVWEYASTVNGAKKAIADSFDKYRYVADSETLPKINLYHYTPDSYLKLGERFAKEYLSIDKHHFA